MIHPDTELSYISPAIGFGLVATRLIPAGTITWVKDPFDLVFKPSEYQKVSGLRKDYLYKYCFVDGNGHYILCWDHGRFVNHCCQANCIAPGFDCEIAVRDIQEGEQLTCDYGLLNMDHEFSCSCGMPECREIVRPSDPEKQHKIWDAKVKKVFGNIDKLAQPLWELVIEKEGITRAVKDPELIPSCLNHYCRKP